MDKWLDFWEKILAFILERAVGHSFSIWFVFYPE